jgi:hypothetical protein
VENGRSAYGRLNGVSGRLFMSLKAAKHPSTLTCTTILALNGT